MNCTAIIPTLNEEGNIGTLIKQLKKYSQIKEIIVVDCNSDDQTQKIAKECGARVCVSPVKNVAYQRNLGAKKAKYQTIIFFDADVLLNKAFIKKLTSQFEKRRLDIACPLYLTNSKRVIVNALHYLFSFIFYLTQKVIPSGAGPCIICKKDFFLSCGGFNDQLVFEDVEFIRRASKNGRYGVINTSITVSDRRFINQGVSKMIIIYILISILFLFGAFRAANAINYWGENNGHRNKNKY